MATFQEWLVESTQIEELRHLLSGWAPNYELHARGADGLRAWVLSRPPDHPMFHMLLDAAAHRWYESDEYRQSLIEGPVLTDREVLEALCPADPAEADSEYGSFCMFCKSQFGWRREPERAHWADCAWMKAATHLGRDTTGHHFR